jgi:DHA1 family tetracycline resistance protein-like MFS transporter
MDTNPPETHQPPALKFIFVTLVLLVLGFGIIIPVLPRLVTQLTGGSVVEGSASYGWLVGIFALMQFIASPILGSLSDRFGRRKIILLALGGAAIDYCIMGLAPTLGWLFVGRMISGITAGALATCNAYIADVTPPEKRAQGFGLVGAAFGLGFIIGPAFGGVLGQHNLRLPFFVAAGCVALNWLYGAFVLPESLPKARRRAFEWKRANPVGALLVLRKFRGVLDLAAMYFANMLGTVILQSIWVLYTGYRYNWSTLQVGLSLTLAGVMAAVVQGGLVRVILARVGERRGLAGGLLLGAFIMMGYGLASKGWMIYALLFVGSLGGVAGPAAQSLITRHVPPDQQGIVQGSLSGLTSLAGIFAPPLAAWSFAACISPHSRLYLPGMPFFEAAVLLMIALALALRSFRIDDALAHEPSESDLEQKLAG